MIANSSIVEPMLKLISEQQVLILKGNAEGRIGSARTEDIGVQNSIDDLRNIAVSSADESDDDDAGRRSCGGG